MDFLIKISQIYFSCYTNQKYRSTFNKLITQNFFFFSATTTRRNKKPTKSINIFSPSSFTFLVKIVNIVRWIATESIRSHQKPPTLNSRLRQDIFISQLGHKCRRDLYQNASNCFLFSAKKLAVVNFFSTIQLQ